MTETNNTRAVKIALVVSVDIKGAWHPPSPKYSNPSWSEQLRVFHKLAIRYRLGFVEAGPPSLKRWRGRLSLVN